MKSVLKYLTSIIKIQLQMTLFNTILDRITTKKKAFPQIIVLSTHVYVFMSFFHIYQKGIGNLRARMIKISLYDCISHQANVHFVN